MATTKKTPAAKTTKPEADEPAAKPSTSRALINWEEQLAADAAASAKMEESTSTGSFFGTKAGQLTWNDAPLANNQMACVITDAILENVTYDAKYDPDEKAGARCFAFGRDDAEMKPHELVFKANMQVNEVCAGCPRNEFGSADTGKGKACGNRRRLAILPAGSLDGNGKFTPYKKESDLMDATQGFLKLPPTAITAFAVYVKQLAATLRRPPHGIFTKIKLVPDAKTQFKFIFEALGPVPNELMAAVMQKREEAKMSIMAPYTLDDGTSTPAAGKGKPAAKKTAARKRY